MPGHPIPRETVAQVQEDVEHLERLFNTHDAVFMLMDSRESRWLLAVLGAAKGKVRLVHPFDVTTHHRHDDGLDRAERGAGI